MFMISSIFPCFHISHNKEQFSALVSVSWQNCVFSEADFVFEQRKKIIRFYCFVSFQVSLKVVSFSETVEDDKKLNRTNSGGDKKVWLTW